MSELVSAYPTAGGIYWWAAKMGKPIHGWFTGWLNLIGLIAVTASVDYGCATFLNITLNRLYPGWDATLTNAFMLFVVILVLHALINIFSHRLIAMLQNVSVWWHVFGAAVGRADPDLRSRHHQTMSFVFTETINNSGFGSDAAPYWFYVLPLGFLLTQYTITGFDACAHVSEETQGASTAAARGLWQSIFYSAIGGWILLLAFLFAATDVDAVNSAGGFVGAIFDSALPGLATAIFAISTIGQFFCGMSCVTSMSRMTYAFSPGRCDPRLAAVVEGGPQPDARQRDHRRLRWPRCITLPALYGAPGALPVAFYAVVSVAVIGLYIAFPIPIWLRLRMGDRFQPGPLDAGSKYKVMCWIAIVEIVIVSIYFIMPLVPAAVPFSADFTWTAVNYAPIVVGVMVLAVGLWWTLSARHWFTGPRRTVDASDPVAPADLGGKETIG